MSTSKTARRPVRRTVNSPQSVRSTAKDGDDKRYLTPDASKICLANAQSSKPPLSIANDEEDGRASMPNTSSNAASYASYSNSYDIQGSQSRLKDERIFTPDTSNNTTYASYCNAYGFQGPQPAVNNGDDRKRNFISDSSENAPNTFNDDNYTSTSDTSSSESSNVSNASNSFQIAQPTASDSEVVQRSSTSSKSSSEAKQSWFSNARDFNADLKLAIDETDRRSFSAVVHNNNTYAEGAKHINPITRIEGNAQGTVIHYSAGAFLEREPDRSARTSCVAQSQPHGQSSEETLPATSNKEKSEGSSPAEGTNGLSLIEMLTEFSRWIRVEPFFWMILYLLQWIFAPTPMLIQKSSA